MLHNRWIVFTLAGSLFVLSQFYRASTAVIAIDLMDQLALTPYALSHLSAAFFYAFALAQIPLAIYLDRIGARATMTVLSLLAAAGALVFASAHSLPMLIVGRAMLGIGMAGNLMGTLKLLTTWFSPFQFATLSALIASLGTLGNIGAATPLVLLVSATGWRMAFIIVSLTNVLLAALFCTIVRNAPDPQSMVTRSAGTPDGGSWRVVFTNRNFWYISIGTFCRYGIFAAVQSLWAGPYLVTAMHFSAIETGNILFLMNMALVFGSPIWGWISDRVLGKRKYVVIIGLLGFAATLAGVAMLPAGAGYWVVVAFFVGIGFFSSAGMVMYSHIKELSPHGRSGAAMTGINFFTMIGAAAFIQGMGRLFDRGPSAAALDQAAFQTAFICCAVILAAVCMLYTLTLDSSPH